MPVHEVRAPDGSIVKVQAPEGATEDEIINYAKQNAPKSLGATILDKAKLYGSAGLRGLLSGPAMASDQLSKNPLAIAGNIAASKLTGLPPMQLGNAAATVHGIGPKPETTADKFITSGIEAATASAVPGAGVKAIAAGGIGGVTGEAANQAAGGGDNPLIRLLGNLVGSLTSGAALARVGAGRPQTADLAKQALEGQSPTELAAAKAFMQHAERQGVPIDLAQALTAVKGSQGAGNTEILRNMLAQSSAGNRTQASLRNQAGSIALATDDALTKLPGKNVGTAAAANDLQRLNTDVIDNVRQARTWLYDDTLKQALASGKYGTKVNESDAHSVLARLDAEIQRFPNTDAKAGFLSDLRQRLLDKTKAADVAPEAERATAFRAGMRGAEGQPLFKPTEVAAAKKPDTPLLDVTQINEVLKERANTLKLGGPDLAAKGIDIGTAKWLNRVIDELREGYGKNFEPIRNANAQYRELTEKVLNPLKQGPTGVLAKRGYSDEVQAAIAPFEAMFKRGTVPGATTSELRTLGRSMSSVEGGAEAYSNALQTTLRRRIAESFDAQASGQTSANLDAPQRLLGAVFGNEAQHQGLKDAVSIVVQNEKGAAAVPAAMRGLDNLHKLLQATANTIKPQGMTQDEIYRMARNSTTANTARIFGFLPFERAARKMEDATMQRTFAELDKLITTPEGIDTLIKLGKQAGSHRNVKTVLDSFWAAQPELAKALPESAPINAQ